MYTWAGRRYGRLNKREERLHNVPTWMDGEAVGKVLENSVVIDRHDGCSATATRKISKESEYGDRLVVQKGAVIPCMRHQIGLT